MSKIALVKTVVAASGFLFLCAGSQLALGQSSQPAAAPAPPAPVKSALTARGRSAGAPDLLEGLTLADEQKTKIAQIREETKSHVAAVKNDRQLSPEAADAMLRGYQRIENGKILDVLTTQQQKEVRKRIAAWTATAGKPQYPLRRAPVSEQTPRQQ
jgi:hypothetical protein